MSAAFYVIAMILLGVVLLAVEIFIIPGFGISGILGLVALIGASVLSFHRLGTMAGALTIGGGAIIAGLMFFLLPKTRAARAMVLTQQHNENVADRSLHALVGQYGVALTTLRPAGTVQVNGQPIDVVTDGEYIEQGTDVRIARVEGLRAIVERLPEADRIDDKGEYRD